MKQDKPNLAKATIHGTFWAYTSSYGKKAMIFISTTILAWLLSQEDFGIAGYALLVIGYLEILSGLGISFALIYFPEDPERLDSGFWVGLGIGLVLFGLTWAIAPLAGDFFNDSRAISVTRVLALAFPISALSIVPEALLRKNLAFKLMAVPDFARAISKGLVSVSLALMGFGFWSLIWGQLVSIMCGVIGYWWVNPWRPSFRFNPKQARSLLPYGLNIVCVRALTQILLNTDYLLVGRFLGAAALGVYTLAFRIPNLLIGQFSEIVGQVLFPVYAKMENDTETIKKGLFLTIRYVSLVTIPVGLGLALVAEPFVLTFFTAKWAAAIPVIVAISIATVLDTLTYNFGDVYKAQGKPEVLTKLSIVRGLIVVPALWWAVTGPGTIVAVGWAVVAISLMNGLIQLAIARQVLNLSFLMILEALRPAAIGAVIMASVVVGILNFYTDVSPLLQLILSVTAGGLSYIGSLWWLQYDVFITAGYTLRNALARR
jgi:PST family polysaccharide transporter